jgi:hypothetical protein
MAEARKCTICGKSSIHGRTPKLVSSLMWICSECDPMPPPQLDLKLLDAAIAAVPDPLDIGSGGGDNPNPEIQAIGERHVRELLSIGARHG